MPRDPPGAPPFPFPIPEAADTPAAPLLFLSLLFVQGAGAGAGMDLSRVGEKLLSSVRSARSLGLLPPPASERPEVPARAAAAAAVARVIAGLPPHQRLNFQSDSAELATVYGSRSEGQVIEELEEGFYEEDFDPIKYVLENIPSEDNDANFFENKATVRLAQLDKITERLSRHVMEHHEEMVKGMQLVMELEQDLKVATVICMNGRRHIASSMQEVSRDLVVNSYSKKKQALLDMIPILTELRHALDMQMALDSLVDDGKYFRAFQVLSEYLQILDNYSDLSAIQEMSHGIEAWLARTLQKLDALLLGVCQSFMEENYVTAVDAYALIGDVSGLAEKIQSFFMQEVLSETHSVLRDLVHEELGNDVQRNRLTYSDLCIQIPESKFRQCLLRTLDALFKLMCSYYAIMSFQPHEKDPDPNTSYSENKEHKISHGQKDEKVPALYPTTSCSENKEHKISHAQKDEKVPDLGLEVSSESSVLSDFRSEQKIYVSPSSLEAVISSNDCNGDVAENLHSQTSTSDDSSTGASSSASPFYQLRKDAMSFVSQTLQRGKKHLWQLITSRVSMLLSCSAVCSTSTYQFLKNYEDLSVFILAGEAFCGVEAVEFRQRLKIVCENYVLAFHRQNIYAFKMVLEKESWVKMTADALHVINLAGLTGDGAPLIVPSNSNNSTLSLLHTKKVSKPVNPGKPKSGFSSWLKIENPFSLKLTSGSKESPTANTSVNRSTISSLADGNADLLHHDKRPIGNHPGSHVNGSNSLLEDENEDLLADFIDEDSQLPSRISNSIQRKTDSGHSNDEEIAAQTGSSLCLLRIMDKYARIMQKLEIVNIEFFKGICQLFGIFYHFIFEAFGQRETSQGGKVLPDSLTPRLRAAIMKIMQDCDQWIRPQNLTSSLLSSQSMNISFTQMDVMPTIPSSTLFAHVPSTSFGLKERCTAAETISLVAHVLHRSKAHLQSMLLQHNTAIIEDFYGNLVDSVPDLCGYIHRTTSRILLHINGYADKIASAKWEVKELGLEHNGYVDLLLGEYKHYKTLLAHGGISKEVQELLLDYGLENVAEILIEGLSRVKRCTDEGRVLMSLDLQVLINGLQHFVSINVKPKLQVVETFIKAYYLPETEYVYWARAHPEYSKSQIVGLVNLVATMKGWKRKTRLETLERIEAGN